MIVGTIRTIGAGG